MMPEIFQELCVRDDVVAVRFPIKNLAGHRFQAEDTNKYHDAILAMAQARDARFMVLDLRTFETISKRMLSLSIRLHKSLRQIGSQFVILCNDDISEIYAITKLDKLIPVFLEETTLQEFLDSAADIPIFVDRQA